jgi:toxin ParE1/3/4
VKIGFARGALDELIALRSFIGRENPDAAQRVFDDLVREALALAAFPNRGRPGRIPRTRELLVPPYVIVYTVRDEELVVLRVLHGARNWP